MPGRKVKWSWSRRLSNSNVVAAVLIRPGHSIAITFPQPDGWTGAGGEVQDFARAILFSATDGRWDSGPAAP